LRSGNITEAQKYINKLNIKDGTNQDLFCQATLGLYAYGIKNYAEGRAAYLEVINQFKKNNELVLQAEAILNFALSEINASTPESREIAIRSLENTETMKNTTIILLRKLLKEKLKSNLS
jgi:hypothetical protein